MDPWLPCGRLIDRFGQRAVYDLGLGKDISVGKFVVNGEWSLPSPTLTDLMDIFAMIRSTTKPNADF